MLNCSYYECIIHLEHYYGSDSDSLTECYIEYFIHEVMEDDESKIQEWINKQRQSFKYAPEFENLLKNQLKNMVILDGHIVPTEFTKKLKLSEKEYVRLLVEYLGNPAFLVEDYESIEW